MDIEIVMDSAVGPYVEYGLIEDPGAIESACPVGWRPSFCDQIKTTAGRYRAPLVEEEDRGEATP